MDRVTTETWTFSLFIANVFPPIQSVITHISYDVNITFISELIRSISRVFQKLLKYFNIIAISTSLVLTVAGVIPFVLALNLNNP